jgi:hypothetical protein
MQRVSDSEVAAAAASWTSPSNSTTTHRVLQDLGKTRAHVSNSADPSVATVGMTNSAASSPRSGPISTCSNPLAPPFASEKEKPMNPFLKRDCQDL